MKLSANIANIKTSIQCWMSQSAVGLPQDGQPPRALMWFTTFNQLKYIWGLFHFFLQIKLQWINLWNMSIHLTTWVKKLIHPIWKRIWPHYGYESLCQPRWHHQQDGRIQSWMSQAAVGLHHEGQPPGALMWFTTLNQLKYIWGLFSFLFLAN
jgi:hypothetical protein